MQASYIQYLSGALISSIAIHPKAPTALPALPHRTCRTTGRIFLLYPGQLLSWQIPKGQLLRVKHTIV